MARPMKTGLDYFPFDVDFFSDRRVRRLQVSFGNDGVSVYICLLCEMYKNGYYLVCDDELAEDISALLNIKLSLTTQIMNYLFSRSLLQLIECKLPEPVKVITAASVQQRYQAAKKGAKRDIVVAEEFWVLSESETESFVKVRPKNGSSRNNESFSGNNSGNSQEESTKKSKGKKSKVKESKAEESKEKDSPPADAPDFCPVMSQEDYDILCKEYGKGVIDGYIRKIGKWQETNRKKVSDGAGLIRKWLLQDGVKKDCFDEDKYAFVINNF